MEKIKMFKMHGDAGHAWLEVPKSLIYMLAIQGDISQCSYEYAGQVFLEEDVDAPLFARAYLRVFGAAPEIVAGDDTDPSPIRRYQSFSA